MASSVRWQSRRLQVGVQLTSWHLEAGIACEHAIATSVEQRDWQRIVDLYDELVGLTPGPVVALNRVVAIAELRGPFVGGDVLRALIPDKKISKYPFFWGALADIERRALVNPLRPRGSMSTR
jgi:predicted RNA polymerase sigma factor